MVIAIMGFVGLLAIPPGYFSTTTVETEEDFLTTLDDELLIATTSLGYLQTNSLTPDDIPESDQSIIALALDTAEVPEIVGGAEKFDIIVNVSQCQPNGDCTETSDRVSPPQLASILDEDGIAVDLDTLNVSFVAESNTEESIIDVWGIFEVYLDDDVIPAESNYFYGHGENTNKIDLSIHNSLDFTVSSSNAIELATKKQELTVESLSLTLLQRTEAQSSTGRFVPDRSLPALRDQLDQEREKLSQLYSSQVSDVKRAVPPAFSALENKEHVLTILSDSNNWATGDEHTYRIVISEIHVVIDSEEHKEFHFNNRHVSYALKVVADESQLAVLDEENNVIQVYKSDSKLQINNFIQSATWWSKSGSHSSYVGDFNPKLLDSIEVLVGGESLGVLSNEDSYHRLYESLRVVFYKCDFSTCSNTQIQKGGHWDSIDNIPRDTDIVIRMGDGQEFEFHTPKTQFNLIVKCENPRTAGPGYICDSNFGYYKDGNAEKGHTTVNEYFGTINGVTSKP